MDKSKLFVSAALALAGTLGAGIAQATTPQLQWSITIGTPVYVRPVRVYVQPLPAYTRPVPVRVQPVALYPHRAAVRPTRWDRDGDGIPNRHDRHDRYHGRGWQGR